MSIEENVCKEKKFHTSTPIYVQCDKLYRQRFAVKNSGMCCLALIFNLSYLRMTILHAKNRLKVAKHDESYTFFFNEIDTNLWLSRTTWVRFQQGAVFLSSLFAILRGTEPVNALRHTLLYCGALKFPQW